MPETGVPAFPLSLGHAAFWSPNYPEGSRFSGQIPALFWLVERHRPATALGLGLDTFEGYFALCQAVSDLGVGALLWGCAAWGESASEPVRGYNAAHHSAFSRLMRMEGQNELEGRFEPGLFDFILVDGRGLSGADPVELVSLLTRLGSARSVIFLQGVVEGVLATVLGHLAETRPVLMLDRSLDAAIVLAGTEPQPQFLALAGKESDEIAALNQLGASHLGAWRLVQEVETRMTQEAALAAVQHRMEEVQAALQTAEAEAERLAEQLAESQATRLRDLRLLTSQLEKQAERLRSEGEAASIALRDEIQAIAQKSEAELSLLKLRHFEDVSNLQSEAFLLSQELVRVRAESETNAERIKLLVADLAREGAELAKHKDRIRALEQDLVKAQQACTVNETEISLLRAAAARKQSEAQVLLRLREWQNQRLREKPRFGALRGPSGEKIAQEARHLMRHPLFDAAWYQSAYPDTKSARFSPAEHFLRHGFYEGRNPGPRLQLVDWFIAHPEALKALKTPFFGSTG